MYKCSAVTYVPFNKCITDKKSVPVENIRHNKCKNRYDSGVPRHEREFLGKSIGCFTNRLPLFERENIIIIIS